MTHIIHSGTVYPLVDLASEVDVNKYIGGDCLFGLNISAWMIQNCLQTVQKVTTAMVKTLRYIQSHSAGEIVAVLLHDVTCQGKEQYRQAIEHYLPTFSKDGVVSEADIKNWLEVGKLFGPIKPEQQIDFSALYTNDFGNNGR